MEESINDSTMRSSVSKFLGEEKQKRQDLFSLPETQTEEIRKGLLDLFLLANGNIGWLQKELIYIESLAFKFKKIYSGQQSGTSSVDEL